MYEQEKNLWNTGDDVPFFDGKDPPPPAYPQPALACRPLQEDRQDETEKRRRNKVWKPVLILTLLLVLAAIFALLGVQTRGHGIEQPPDLLENIQKETRS